MKKSEQGNFRQRWVWNRLGRVPWGNPARSSPPPWGFRTVLSLWGPAQTHSLGGAPLAVAAAKRQIVLARGWACCWLSCFYSLCLFLFESKLPPRAVYDTSQAAGLAALRVVWGLPCRWERLRSSAASHISKEFGKGLCQDLAQCTIYINSFHLPQSYPKREVLLLPFCSRGKWGSERLSHFLKATEQWSRDSFISPAPCSRLRV